MAQDDRLLTSGPDLCACYQQMKRQVVVCLFFLRHNLTKKHTCVFCLPFHANRFLSMLNAGPLIQLRFHIMTCCQTPPLFTFSALWCRQINKMCFLIDFPSAVVLLICWSSTECSLHHNITIKMKKCPKNGLILLMEVVFIRNNNKKKYAKAKSLLGVLFFFCLHAGANKATQPCLLTSSWRSTSFASGRSWTGSARRRATSSWRGTRSAPSGRSASATWRNRGPS